MIVAIEDFEALFPRPLAGGERDRAEALLGKAESRIVAAFARQGRDFLAEVASSPWLSDEAEQVVLEMVSAVILTGPDAGRVSSSTTAGLVSESGTWADPSGTAWGQLVLTDDQRSRLGLLAGGMPTGRFPSPSRWPERRMR